MSKLTARKVGALNSPGHYVDGDRPGLPMGGRRAISFSDSRQGVARLAAKLQQDAERKGALSPLVRGPASAPDPADSFSSERLVQLSAGNARLVWIRKQLDGSATRFGKGFWQMLAQQEPLTIAALKAHGITEAAYSDRYLVTPLNLRLLYEVIAAMPGRTDETRLAISTARLDRPANTGWAMFHNFNEDSVRQDTTAALLPGASVNLSKKADLPHARSLTLRLGDGRRLRLLLDQGFGAWRVEGNARHDFRASPAEQARAIRRAELQLRMNEERGGPVLLETL